ncbi:hypothetical protein ASD21_03375 [Caulobacter sp. Root1455]|jgi:hypothetical protein|uniref:DUF1993 domain-containing protein n=1 Tax=unclassified Caulobacter TaxID=2648921 RepID=UPI0006FBC95C|nr:MULTISPECIES: DUF1993 domain-containing protein [unclassified Caulobacter]KQY28855.1 hypothetical protein ASD38_14530 [Caulobacter sp. Root487D2Y]KQY99010.1 hypothetical protein ASD21_03375 [Caulobacter sp. Root1455]
MPLSMHRASVPVFVRALKVLATLLEKGEAHAKAQGQNPDDLVGARLADDMLPLSGQVQRASDASKGAVSRLTGVDAPAMADEETTLAQLKTRVADTLAYIESVDPKAFEGSEERTVELKLPGGTLTFTGEDYLLTFALPNFFFHVVTAYDVLRHKGVQIGKLDYMGPVRS